MATRLCIQSRIIVRSYLHTFNRVVGSTLCVAGYYWYDDIKQDREVNNLIQWITNITNDQIVMGNTKIAPVTGCNMNVNNPTACGTYANSLLAILPAMYYINTLNTNLSYVHNIYFRSGYNNIVNINHVNLNEYFRVTNMKDTREIIHFTISSSVVTLPCGKQVYFPGHAFVIIKVHPNRYILSQSYLNVYNHKQCTFELNTQQVLKVARGFQHMCQVKTIDDYFIASWNYLTGTKIDEWKHGRFKNNCFVVHKLEF